MLKTNILSKCGETLKHTVPSGHELLSKSKTLPHLILAFDSRAQTYLTNKCISLGNDPNILLNTVWLKEEGCHSQF